MRRIRLGWVVLGAAVLAVISARPYAGAWNDGSRLATVESLVDRQTFVIDDSIYLSPALAARPPYDPDNLLVARYGTFDKLLIGGRYYSDKSPVPAVLMGVPYQVWRAGGGAAAAERPDLFARGLTWLFAGLPFVLAVWAVGRAARSIGVPAPWDVLLPAGFAFTGLDAAYAAYVNNHVLLLAVAAGVCEAAVRRGPLNIGRCAWLGVLAGVGYTIDLGAGPPLAVATAGLVAWKSQRRGKWGLRGTFLLAAVPFVLANHVLTYAIAGTIGPANANPEYLNWPGSPFQGPQMTGGWHHASVAAAGVYALDLLYGKKGFLLHAPPLLLAVTGLPAVLGRRLRERPALLALGAWALATWLLYAATSRNHSGMCLSIRWFVPLLAPGYLALAVLVREVPTTRTDLGLLLLGGFLLGPEVVIRGPWDGHVLYTFWPVVGLTLIAWGVLRVRRAAAWLRRRAAKPITGLPAIPAPFRGVKRG